MHIEGGQDTDENHINDLFEKFLDWSKWVTGSKLACCHNFGCALKIFFFQFCTMSGAKSHVLLEKRTCWGWMGYCRPENSVFLCPQNSGSALNDLFYDFPHWKGWRSTQKFNNGFYENFLFDLMRLFIWLMFSLTVLNIFRLLTWRV